MDYLIKKKTVTSDVTSYDEATVQDEKVQLNAALMESGTTAQEECEIVTVQGNVTQLFKDRIHQLITDYITANY